MNGGSANASVESHGRADDLLPLFSRQVVSLITDICVAITAHIQTDCARFINGMRTEAEYASANFSRHLVAVPRSAAHLAYRRMGDAENARHEIAGHENARNAIVWNTACCICLSTAEQECMSRQQRAPDFAADCVLVND